MYAFDEKAKPLKVGPGTDPIQGRRLDGLESGLPFASRIALLRALVRTGPRRAQGWLAIQCVSGFPEVLGSNRGATLVVPPELAEHAERAEAGGAGGKAAATGLLPAAAAGHLGDWWYAAEFWGGCLAWCWDGSLA